MVAAVGSLGYVPLLQIELRQPTKAQQCGSMGVVVDTSSHWMTLRQSGVDRYLMVCFGSSETNHLTLTLLDTERLDDVSQSMSRPALGTNSGTVLSWRVVDPRVTCLTSLFLMLAKYDGWTCIVTITGWGGSAQP